jgi:hypothetical protein
MEISLRPPLPCSKMPLMRKGCFRMGDRIAYLMARPVRREDIVHDHVVGSCKWDRPALKTKGLNRL